MGNGTYTDSTIPVAVRGLSSVVAIAGGDSQSLAIKNSDSTPPVIAGMPKAGYTLWPVDGKLVTVAIVTASDALSGLAPGSFKVTGTSNEPDPRYSDIVITPNESGGFVVQLRAARWGHANDRIYTLTATASDLAGNTASATGTCTVPHDQGK